MENERRKSSFCLCFKIWRRKKPRLMNWWREKGQDNERTMWTSICKKDTSTTKHLIKEHQNESIDNNNRERSNSEDIPIEEVFSYWMKKDDCLIEIAVDSHDQQLGRCWFRWWTTKTKVSSFNGRKSCFSMDFDRFICVFSFVETKRWTTWTSSWIFDDDDRKETLSFKFVVDVVDPSIFSTSIIILETETESINRSLEKQFNEGVQSKILHTHHEGFGFHSETNGSSDHKDKLFFVPASTTDDQRRYSHWK